MEIDLFCSGSGAQRAVTLGTVSGNSCPFSGGAGDNLPPATTAITAMLPVSNVLSVPVGANVDVIYAFSPVQGYVVFVDNSSADITACVYKIKGVTDSHGWDSGNGVTNPLSGVIVSGVKFSHGDVNPQVLEAGVTV